MLVKIKLEDEQNQGKKMKKNTHEIAKVTYKSLGLKEHALEEFLQENISILTEDEDYEMMVIGKQVINNTNKRTDLVALDSNGNIVIIEIKRDEEDMKQRKDNFESQAIRYASSFTTISSIEMIVEKVYAKYLARYEHIPEAEAAAVGVKRIEDFLEKNQAINQFNADQRIMLVASSFDPNVLSVSAWLLAKGVDISCVEISPQKIEGDETAEYLLEVKKILPLGSDNDYYTDILSPDKKGKTASRKSGGTRKTFPKLTHMIEAGIVSEGDEIFFRGKEMDSKATIHKENLVEFNGKIISLNTWAKQFPASGKVNAYEYAIVTTQNKTLAEIRAAHYHVFDGMGFDEIN